MKKIKKIKLSKFRTKRNMNFLTVFLCLDLLIVFSLLKTSNASYIAEAVGSTDVNVALYAFNVNVLEGDDTANIDLGSLSPGQTKLIKIQVKNTDSNGIISDTNIDYTLKIITTTNLDLQYQIYKNAPVEANRITNAVTTTSNDAYGTPFRYIAIPSRCMSYTSAVTDIYYLKVTFPSGYNSYVYQDLIESIKVQLVSEQSTGSSCGG